MSDKIENRKSEIENAPLGYVCLRAPEPIAIDGQLDKPAWQSAPWTADFVDIEGDAKSMPRFRTRAKMLWDEEFFYIGAELREPHVWATLTEHDSVIFNDNDFEVFIDPDGDCHDYYEIEINALNTTWDLRLAKPYRDGGPALDEWESCAVTAVQVDGTLNDPADTDRAWTVEMAIPWRALGEFARCSSPPSDGDRWRVNFSRVEWQVDVVEGQYVKAPNTPEDNWVWSPQFAVDMHRPERWGYVQFSEATIGSVPFVPDPAWPARDRLSRVYHAQRTWHEAYGEYAASLDQLALGDEFQSVRIMPTSEGYVALLSELYPDGTEHTWSIRQDSLSEEVG